MPSSLPAEWTKSALEITGSFENATDPFGGVSGDFDGQGISLGVLQWNIGQGSLQSLVTALGRDAVVGLMPSNGPDFWTACTGTTDQGLQIVRSWQTGSTLGAAVLKELKAFCHSGGFVAQQVAAADAKAQSAFAAATSYAAADPNYGDVTKRLFCWFFDVHTQNGGLGSITYADVDAFIKAKAVLNAVPTICNWLKNRTSDEAGSDDAHKNADQWLDSVPKAQLTLLVLSYLRAIEAKPEWKADTLNRKGTIAVGVGFVHGSKRDLNAALSGS